VLENGILRLGFPKGQELAAESLSRPNHRKLLEDVLSEILGDTWKMEFETRDDLSSPAQNTAADSTQTFKNDPMIQKALEIFKAEIQSDR